MEVHIIDGEREGSRIYHCGDGHHYHYNNENSYLSHEGLRNGTLYVRCINYNSRACSGSAKIIVQGGRVVSWENSRRHTCMPRPGHHDIVQLRQAILRESRNMEGRYETPTELVNRINGRHRAQVAAEVPASRIRSAIYRARAALFPPVPITLQNLGNLLMQHDYRHLTNTLDGTDNLFGGMAVTPGGQFSVVFASRRMRRRMRTVKVVFCDGTFASRPNTPQSSQVLQINTVIGNKVVPLCQVLMTSKLEEEYISVLQHIHQLVPQFRPRLVMTDFETALQNAWKEVFPQAQVVGCYWHFCRAILIKAREKGLVPLMNADHRLRSIVRSCCAIPLLPTHLMARGLSSLIMEAARLDILGPELHDFFGYMVDTWFGNAHFNNLSVYGLPHRTNNVSESSNRTLRNRTGVHRPGLWQYLAAVKIFERDTYLSLWNIHVGLRANRPRKISAINNDIRIRNYTANVLRGDISVKTFLHRASTRVLNVFDRFV